MRSLRTVSLGHPQLARDLGGVDPAVGAQGPQDGLLALRTGTGARLHRRLVTALVRRGPAGSRAARELVRAGVGAGREPGEQRGAAGARLLDPGARQLAEGRALDLHERRAARPPAGHDHAPVRPDDGRHRPVDPVGSGR